MNITSDCKLLLDEELRYGFCPLNIEHNLLKLLLLSPKMSAKWLGGTRIQLLSLLHHELVLLLRGHELLLLAFLL